MSEEHIKAINACRGVMQDYLVEMMNSQKKLMEASQSVIQVANSNKEIADSFQFIIKMAESLRGISQQINFVNTSIVNLQTIIRERYAITDNENILKEISDLKEALNQLKYYKITRENPQEIQNEEKIIVFSEICDELSYRSLNILDALELKDSNDLRRYTLKKLMDQRSVGKKTIYEIQRVLKNHKVFINY